MLDAKIKIFVKIAWNDCPNGVRKVKGRIVVLLNHYLCKVPISPNKIISL